LKVKSAHLVLLGAVLAVSACHRAPPAPTGQVAANVGSREITVRELRAELANAPAVAPAAQKAQQAAALNVIIDRAILADVARKQGLDKDPNFLLLSQRANDALLVQQLEGKIAASVPAPAHEEVAQFENANPDLFAQRKIFDVEQIRMGQPADPNFVKQLEPLKTLDDIASFLTQNKVPFQRGSATIDALSQNPKLITAIIALPPQEVFIIPSGNLVLVNLIHGTRTEPFTGDAADKYATNYLRAQHTQDAVRKQLGAYVSSAQSTVQIAKDYQLPPAKPAAAPAQPGAAPSPAPAAASKGG
jgi:EpsD family peptidyl-prolyl cis-trans isomerase